MRPISRRLRVLAAVLALAQGAAPAVAIAHEAAGAASRAPQAHVESQGATHDVAEHLHDCGICRHVVSKGGTAIGPVLGASDYLAARRGPWHIEVAAVTGGYGLVPLPRGPPLG